MIKKNKVPRWFDQWYKQVVKAVEAWGPFRSFGAKELAINAIAKIGLKDDRHDVLEVREIDQISEFSKHYEYVKNHKFVLIKAIIDGYEVEEEKGYVMLDGTKDIDGNALYVAEPDGRWCVSVRKYSITRSQYDNAPAWVKACKFTPVESEDED